jgi:GT2 family glycosyltransferase
MKLVVIIPTYRRKEFLNRVLDHLVGQARTPNEVIVSAPDDTHIAPFSAKHFPVTYVFGREGLCAQRNQALDQALNHSDVITFFDDDFLPADAYLRRVEEAFQQHPDWAVIMGHAVADGARNAGYTFDQGLTALRSAEQRDVPLRVVEHVGAYGCNMSIRSSLIGDLRFDERLALYGWQEDIDFTSQLRRHGRVVGLSTIYGVHLGLKSGRVSGLKFGYSQVVNPVYLIRKGTVPARFALELLGRNVAANLIKSLWPEPYIDRWGRLKGNLLAASHLIRGRVDPEYILKL